MRACVRWHARLVENAVEIGVGPHVEVAEDGRVHLGEPGETRLIAVDKGSKLCDAFGQGSQEERGWRRRRGRRHGWVDGQTEAPNGAALVVVLFAHGGGVDTGNETRLVFMHSDHWGGRALLDLGCA